MRSMRSCRIHIINNKDPYHQEGRRGSLGALYKGLRPLGGGWESTGYDVHIVKLRQKPRPFVVPRLDSVATSAISSLPSYRHAVFMLRSICSSMPSIILSAEVLVHMQEVLALRDYSATRPLKYTSSKIFPYSNLQPTLGTLNLL